MLVLKYLESQSGYVESGSQLVPQMPWGVP